MSCWLHHPLGPGQAVKISSPVYWNDFPNWSFSSLTIHCCQISPIFPSLAFSLFLNCTISSLPEKYSPDISGPSRSAANLCSGCASYMVLLFSAALRIVWTSQDSLNTPLFDASEISVPLLKMSFSHPMCLGVYLLWSSQAPMAVTGTRPVAR